MLNKKTSVKPINFPSFKGDSSITGESSIHTISDGIIISRNTNANNLAIRLRFDIVSSIARYSLDPVTCELILLFKEWLSDYDFYWLFEVVEKNINISLLESILSRDKSKELKAIMSRVDVNIPGSYASILMDKYGKEVVIDGKVNYTEIHYNFPNYVEAHKDQILFYNDKIGSLDLETYAIKIKSEDYKMEKWLSSAMQWDSQII